MKPIEIISQDVFDKIRSRFSNLEMGDETGAVTSDPKDARFFDFDFVKEGTDLGRVSISLNDIGSLKIFYSQGITENTDSSAKKVWYEFLKEMRYFAKRRLLRFDTRDISKTHLDKNDFKYLATKQGPKDDEMTTAMNESRWNNRSSRKTSRAVKGKTEVIVRHHAPVNETIPSARSQRKNIKAIFIQNRDGERFKYPFIHPAGAFAMAQHVDHGGIPHDPGGKAIIEMSEQIAQLQEFQRKINKASLNPDATGISERALGRLTELKSQIEALGKRRHYEAWIAEFNEQDHEQNLIDDLDAVTMEEYKSKFTQTSYNEELSSFFPLLHKIMNETNKVNLDDYVKEGGIPSYPPEVSTGMGALIGAALGGPAGAEIGAGASELTRLPRNIRQPDEEFEDWAGSLTQTEISPDQAKGLKLSLDKLEQEGTPLELGPDGEIAWKYFNDFGLMDPSLRDELRNMSEIDPTTDPLLVLKAWAEKNYPELLVALGMSGSAEEQPEQPTAENDELIPPNTTLSSESLVKYVAEQIKKFHNVSNEDVAPFRAEENIATDIKKKVEEELGEALGEKARKIALSFMQKKNNEWKESRGSNQLLRLKALSGISDQGDEEQW